MKKLLSKLVPAVLGIMMMSSITAFAEVNPDAKAVYDNMEAKSSAMTDANMFAHFYMIMMADGERADMSMDMSVLCKNMNQPDKVEFLSQVKILVENQPLEATLWYKDGYSYTDMMGQKLKTQNDLSSFMSTNMGLAGTMGSTSDLFSDLTLTTDGQNRILNYKMDDAKMNAFTQTVFQMAGMGDLFSSSGIQMTLRDIQGTYVLTPDNLYSTATITMAMDMTVEGETLTVMIAGNMNFADPGQPVVLNLPDPAGYQDISAYSPAA